MKKLTPLHMNFLHAFRTVLASLPLLVCLVHGLAGSVLRAEEDPRIARDDRFPTAGAGVYLAGELTHVDHVNRTGILRPDRKGTIPGDFWDLPHAFDLPPYAIVRYRGAPTELRDIPLGTHLHGTFYLGPQGDYEIKAPGFPNSPAVSMESQYCRPFLLEDDFSFHQRLGTAWKIVDVDVEKHRLAVELVSTGKPDVLIPASPPPEMSGQKQFRIERATRIWTGRQIGRLEDLAVGQIVQANLSWVTVLGTTYQKAVTDIADDAVCRDIWIDEESRAVATEQQRQIHIAYQQRRGIPARVDFTEHVEGAGARGYVTVTLYAGVDPELYEPFREKISASVRTAEPTLRSYIRDSKSGRIETVTRLDNPPPGSSGIQLRIHIDELLEGMRRGRSVRMAASGWIEPERLREERLWPRDVREFRVGPQGIAGREPVLNKLSK
ncbi:MAG TPA: hypothetical protein VNQ76_01340 [Planctomicrobium sp.]|nr:hypothetical protein [Planctomicrobium sp.]